MPALGGRQSTALICVDEYPRCERVLVTKTIGFVSIWTAQLPPLRDKRIDGRLGQSREPASDRFLDALWNRQLVRFLALPALALAIDLSLLDERLDDLFDEKRIAFGLAVKRHREVVGHARLSEQRREQGAGIRKGQASKRHARRQPLAVPLHQRRGKRMRAIELDLAVRPEQQDAVAAQMAQQIMQKRKRALIGPVQVVDEHQKPPLRGGGALPRAAFVNS